jgi:pimeloyl-ACP methyl ester carboxylesterase
VSQVARRFVSAEAPGLGRAGAGGHPCQGVWHHPAGEVRPAVAFVATHYEVDFSEHYLAEPLARRGFGFLGWNTRYRGQGAYFRLQGAVTDIGVGMRWLREEAGAGTVVLLGNSGGASLMAAYQARALEEADPDLPAADLFVSLNAHPGRPDVLTAWLDPAVTDETDPLSVYSGLDMFNPDHGPPYPPEFRTRYRAAQVERNERITGWCRAELERLGARGAWDRLFAVPRTWADLRFLDLTVDPSERPVGCYAGDPRPANYGPAGLAAACTLRGWLEMWSLDESGCRAGPHLARITEPALVVQSDADQGCFPSDARAIHAALGSADRTLVSVPGDHYLLQPGGARETVADLVSTWVEERVSPAG